jgi:hypothetical protein
MTDRYELVYGTGGHGGPHHGLQAAQDYARKLLAGSKTETVVYVVPCDKPFHPQYAVATVRKDTDAELERKFARLTLDQKKALLARCGLEVVE